MDPVQTMYETLKNNKDLTDELADKEQGIRADLTSYSGRYPVLCYQVISDVPHMWADDEEIARRITVQLSLLTLDGADDEIIHLLKKSMEELGWARISASRLLSGKIRMTALRYVLAESEEEE